MIKTALWLKRRVAFLTLLFITAAIVYSCKKNVEQGNPEGLVSQLESTFNRQKLNGTSLSNKFAGAGLNPDWKNAVIKKNRANKPLVIIPLQNTANSYAEMDMVLSKGLVNSIVKKYTLNANHTVTLQIFRPGGVLIMSGLYHSRYKKFTPNQSPIPNISLFSPASQLGGQILLSKNSTLLSERLVSLHVNKLMGNSGGNGSTNTPEDECPPGTICLDDVTITAPAPQSPTNDDPGVDIPDLPPSGPTDYFPTEPTIPTGTQTESEPPATAINPCTEAKALTKALNEALEKQEVKDMMTALKGTKNSNVEHGFLITKDANGYHATAMVTGGANSVEFTSNANTNVVFVVHVHPPGASAAPSSTDILGLGNYGADFEGNVIISGDDMYMVSITDQTAYDKFRQKSTEKNYYDKDSSNGWKDKSEIDREFNAFSGDYIKMYSGVDGTYPTQLYLMNRYKMGTTVQKWSASENKFQPQELNIESNNNTGSSSTIGGGGNVINSRYKKIEVDKKDCPN